LFVLSLHFIKLLPLVDAFPAGRQELLQLLAVIGFRFAGFLSFSHVFGLPSRLSAAPAYQVGGRN
jgi:hypothetical protein